MKINPSNFLQINKTGHNLLSIFVVLSLIFNPLLPHIPVAEAEAPTVPSLPRLKDIEADGTVVDPALQDGETRSAYTAGDTDGRISAAKDITIVGCSPQESVISGVDSAVHLIITNKDKSTDALNKAAIDSGLYLNPQGNNFGCATDGNGNIGGYEYTILSTDLEPGENRIVVQSQGFTTTPPRAPSGEISGESEILTITVDDTAVIDSSVLSLEASSQIDTTTPNSTTPTFELSNVEANSAVELYLSNVATPTSDDNLSLLGTAASPATDETASVTVGETLTGYGLSFDTTDDDRDKVDADLLKGTSALELYIVAKIVDAVGNISNISSVFTLTPERTDSPTDITLENASSSLQYGTSGRNVYLFIQSTDLGAIEIEGTAEIGSTIKIKNGDTVFDTFDTTESPFKNTFSIPPSLQTVDGFYSLSVTAQKDPGVESLPTPFYISVIATADPNDLTITESSVGFASSKTYEVGFDTVVEPAGGSKLDYLILDDSTACDASAFPNDGTETHETINYFDYESSLTTVSDGGTQIGFINVEGGTDNIGSLAQPLLTVEGIDYEIESIIYDQGLTPSFKITIKKIDTSEADLTTQIDDVMIKIIDTSNNLFEVPFGDSEHTVVGDTTVFDFGDQGSVFAAGDHTISIIGGLISQINIGETDQRTFGEVDNGKFLCVRSPDAVGKTGNKYVTQEIRRIDTTPPEIFIIRTVIGLHGHDFYAATANDVSNVTFTTTTDKLVDSPVDEFDAFLPPTNDKCEEDDLSTVTPVPLGKPKVDVPYAFSDGGVISSQKGNVTNTDNVCVKAVDEAGNISYAAAIGNHFFESGVFTPTILSGGTNVPTAGTSIVHSDSLDFSLKLSTTRTDINSINLYIVDDGETVDNVTHVDTVPGSAITGLGDVTLSETLTSGGEYDIYISVDNDNFSNVNHDNESRYKIIDLIVSVTGPVQPSVPTLNASSDSFRENTFGTSSDNITTQDLAISVRGCAPSGSTVSSKVNTYDINGDPETSVAGVDTAIADGEVCSWTPSGGTEEQGREYNLTVQSSVSDNKFTGAPDGRANSIVVEYTNLLSQTSDPSDPLTIYIDDGFDTTNSVIGLTSGLDFAVTRKPNVQVTNIEKDSVVELYEWSDDDINNIVTEDELILLISIGDTGGETDDSTVEFVLNEATTTLPAGYNPTTALSLGNFADGFGYGNSYALVARSVDAAGNVSEFFGTNAISILQLNDNKPISLSIDDNDATFIAASDIYVSQIKINANDKVRVSGVTKPNNVLQMLVDGAEVGDTSNRFTASDTGLFTVEFPADAFDTAGTYALTVASSTDGVTAFETSEETLTLRIIDSLSPDIKGYVETVGENFIDTSDTTIEEFALQIVRLDETIPVRYDVISIEDANGTDLLVTPITTTPIRDTNVELRGESFAILTGDSSINNTALAGATLPIKATVRITDSFLNSSDIVIYSYPQLTVTSDEGLTVDVSQSLLATAASDETITRVLLASPTDADYPGLYDKCNIGYASEIDGLANDRKTTFTTSDSETFLSEEDNGKSICFITTETDTVPDTTAYKSYNVNSIDTFGPTVTITPSDAGVPAQEKTYTFEANDVSIPKYGFVYKYLTIDATDAVDLAAAKTYCEGQYGSGTEDFYNNDDTLTHNINFEGNNGLHRHDVSVDENGNDLPVYTGTFTANTPGGTSKSFGFRRATTATTYGTLSSESETDIVFGQSRHGWREIAYNTMNKRLYISFFAYNHDNDNTTDPIYVDDAADDLKIKITDNADGTVHADRLFSSFYAVDNNSDGVPDGHFSNTASGDERTVFFFIKATPTGVPSDLVELEVDDIYDFEVYHDPVTFDAESDNGKYLCVGSVDEYGLESWEAIEVENIDNTDPVITVANVDTDTYFAFANEDVTMEYLEVLSSVTACDTVQTGVDGTGYAAYTPYVEQKKDEGSSNNLCFKATDLAGNISYAISSSGSISIINNLTLYSAYTDDSNNTPAPGDFGYQTGITNLDSGIIFTASNGNPTLNTRLYIVGDGLSFDPSIAAESIPTTIDADANGDLIFPSVLLTEGEWDVYTANRVGSPPAFLEPIKILDLTIDSTAPLQPSETNLANDTSRSAYDGTTDKITKAEDINITGCAEEGSTVDVFIDSTSSSISATPGPDSSSCAAAGQTKYEFTIPISELSSSYTGETNEIEIQATDKATNNSFTDSAEATPLREIIDITIDSGVDIASTASISLKDDQISTTGISTPTFVISGIEVDSAVEIYRWVDADPFEGEKDDTEIVFLGASAVTSDLTEVTVGESITDYTPTTTGDPTKEENLTFGDHIISVNVVDKVGNEVLEALDDYTVTYVEAQTEPTELQITNAGYSLLSLGTLNYFTNKTTDIAIQGIAQTGTTVKLYYHPTGDNTSPISITDLPVTNNSWSTTISTNLSEDSYNVYATSTPIGGDPITDESAASTSIILKIDLTGPEVTFNPKSPGINKITYELQFDGEEAPDNNDGIVNYQVFENDTSCNATIFDKNHADNNVIDETPYDIEYGSTNNEDYLCVVVDDRLVNTSYASIQIDTTPLVITFATNSEITNDTTHIFINNSDGPPVVRLSADDTSNITLEGSCGAASASDNLSSVNPNDVVDIYLVQSDGSTALEDGVTYTNCIIKATDPITTQVSAVTLQSFTIDNVFPTAPVISSITDTAVSGLSLNNDGQSNATDVTITGCGEANSEVFAYIDDNNGNKQQSSTSTTAGDVDPSCTDSTHGTYTLTIDPSDVDVSKSNGGQEFIFTTVSTDNAQNESIESATVTQKIDYGVVNFDEVVTLFNNDLIYYIQVADEGSSIKYLITEELDADTAVVCSVEDYSSATAYDSKTGVSKYANTDGFGDKNRQICFEVVDSSLVATYYNSKNAQEEASSVLSSLDSATFGNNSGDTTDNITNNTQPNIIISNVEGAAAVEIYTWVDDTTPGISVGLIQESELTLRGVTQNTDSSVGDVTVSWGNNINTYTPTINNIPADNELTDDGTYYFTARIVDFVGNTSLFTPVTDVEILTTTTDTITLEANPNVITTTNDVNYLNRLNEEKDTDNDLVRLSSSSTLSNVEYTGLQSAATDCATVADSEFTTTIPTTLATATATDGFSFIICAKANDIHDNTVYADFGFTLDTIDPVTPTLDTPTDAAFVGLSTDSDGETTKGDITITGCAEENTEVHAYITVDSLTEKLNTFDVADDTATGCTVGNAGYSLVISDSDLTSSRAGTANTITVSSFDDAENESGTPTGFTFTIDEGVVNFNDIATVFNIGTDYYVSATDDSSSISYEVTGIEVTSTSPTAVCDDGSYSYNNAYDATTGVSNIVPDNLGVEQNREICFRVTDKNTPPNISYYNSAASIQTTFVLPSLDSVTDGNNSGDTTDNITNNTQPNIIVSNVESLAAVEIYTWVDDSSDDGVVQESELILRGFAQNTDTNLPVVDLTVSWGKNSNTTPNNFDANYAPTQSINTTALLDGTHYFTARVVDFVGNISPYTPVTDVEIITTTTDTITLEANPNVITTTNDVNYLNRVNEDKGTDNDLVRLSSSSTLSNVEYTGLQFISTDCATPDDSEFTTTIPTTLATSTANDGLSFRICARADDIHHNTVYAFFEFTLDRTDPVTPTLNTPTDAAFVGLSTDSDGETTKGDITITGCAEENTEVHTYITVDSLTEKLNTFDVADDTATGCTVGNAGYSLVISDSDLTSSRAGTANTITVSSFDDAENESGTPTGFTFTIDEGVVNFSDGATLTNIGTDYYISADDADSEIKYVRITDTAVACDDSSVATNYDSTASNIDNGTYNSKTGISNVRGLETNLHICFRVTDSNSGISYYSSITNKQEEASSVLPSLDSVTEDNNSGDTTDNITNNTQPNIIVSNVESLAAVEIYTWDDASPDGGTTPADNVVQESELILRGFAQNTDISSPVVDLTVSWGKNSNTPPNNFDDNYAPTPSINTTALLDGTHYFTARVVDFVGNKSPFTPIETIVVDTITEGTISLQANPNVITTTNDVNYLNKLNQEKTIDNAIVSLSNLDSLTGVIYTPIQVYDSTAVPCTIYLDSTFSLTTPPITDVLSSSSDGEYEVCVRAFDGVGNVDNDSFRFTLDTVVPEVPEVTALTQSTDSSVSGLSSDIDARTQDQDVVISGCTQDQIDIYEIDETAQHLATSLNIDTNGTCDWTPEGGIEQTGNPYTISIPAANTSSNKTETSNIITVRAKDDAQNTSLSNKFTFYLDSGVVNFNDIATVFNIGTDYYISATDDSSSISYEVTGTIVTPTPTAVCNDGSYSYNNAYDATTGVSNIVPDNLGVPQNREICFRVTDKNTTPNTHSYYNSVAAVQTTSVLPSLDSATIGNNTGDTADNITSKNTPNILVSNVEVNAAVEIYTWVDDTSADGVGVIQASELTLRGFAQNTDISSPVGNVIVSWAEDIPNYGPSITTTALLNGTHYFTARVVDYVGNTSQYLTPTSVEIQTGDSLVNSVTLETNTSPSQFSEALVDNITKEDDIQLIACAESGTTLTLQDENNNAVTSTVTEDTTDTTTCTVAGDSKFTIDIASGTLQASASGITYDLHIDLENSAGTVTNGLNYQSAQISITLDSGIVDFSSVTPSINEGKNKINDTTPNVTLKNVEYGAIAEIYTWVDDSVADGVVQASELTLRGVTQNPSTDDLNTTNDVEVEWGGLLSGYTITENQQANETELLDNTTYQFVGRAVDLAGYTSSFTLPVDILISTSPTDISFTADSDIINTNGSTNYVNKSGYAFSGLKAVATISKEDTNALDVETKYTSLLPNQTNCSGVDIASFSLNDPFTNNKSLDFGNIVDGQSYTLCARAVNEATVVSYASFEFTVNLTGILSVSSFNLRESSDSSRGAYPAGKTDGITHHTGGLIFDVCVENGADVDFADSSGIILVDTGNVKIAIPVHDTQTDISCPLQTESRQSFSILSSHLTSPQEIYLNIVDHAGNPTVGASTGISFVVTLDNEVTFSSTPDEIPSLSLTSPNADTTDQTNSGTPRFTLSNVEANAMVELYEWNDDGDGTVQDSELTLRSTQPSVQNIAGDVDIIFGNIVPGYISTTLNTVEKAPLIDGDYTFVALIVDVANNTSSYSDIDSFTFTVEKIGSPPENLHLEHGTYHSIHNNVYYSRSSTEIIVNGSGVADEFIQVYADGNPTALGSATIPNGQNRWSIKINLAASATPYSITATATIPGFSVSSAPSEPILVFVDNIVPPFVPDAVSLDSAYDTGRPNTITTTEIDFYQKDDYTSYTDLEGSPELNEPKDLVFSGCAEENSTISITVGTTAILYTEIADGADCTDANNNTGKTFTFTLSTEVFANIQQIDPGGTPFIIEVISTDRSGNKSGKQSNTLTITIDSGTPDGFPEISLLDGFSTIVFVTDDKQPTFRVTDIEPDSIVELYVWDDDTTDTNNIGVINSNELKTIATVESDKDLNNNNQVLEVKYGTYVNGYTPEVGQTTTLELSANSYAITGIIKDKAGNVSGDYITPSEFTVTSIDTNRPTGLSLHVDSYNLLENHTSYFTNTDIKFLNIRGYADYAESSGVATNKIELYDDDFKSTPLTKYTCTSPTEFTDPANPTSTTCAETTDVFVDSNYEWSTYIVVEDLSTSYNLFAKTVDASFNESQESNTISITVDKVVDTTTPAPSKPIVTSTHIVVADTDTTASGRGNVIYQDQSAIIIEGCASISNQVFVYLDHDDDPLNIRTTASGSVCIFGAQNDAGQKYEITIPVNYLDSDDYGNDNIITVTSRTKTGVDSVESESTTVYIDSEVKGVSLDSTLGNRITASLHEDSDTGTIGDNVTSDSSPMFQVSDVEGRSYVELYVWNDLNNNGVPETSIVAAEDELKLVGEKASLIGHERTNEETQYTVNVDFGNEESGHSVDNKNVDNTILEDGEYDFVIRVVDKVGNTSGYIPAVDGILISTTKPEATVNEIGITNNPVLQVLSGVDVDTTVSFVSGPCNFKPSGAEDQLFARAQLNIDIRSNANRNESLSEGTYDDCVIRLTSAVEEVSDDIVIPEFIVDLTSATLSEEEAINNPTNNPTVTIKSTEDGTVSFTGGCVPTKNDIIVTEIDVIEEVDTLIRFDTSGLTSGTTYTCVATVTDIAGNESTLDLSPFIFDNTPPEPQEATAVSTPSGTQNPSVEINSDEAGTLTFSGTSGCETTNTINISANIDTTVIFGTLGDGIYNCAVQVTDEAGNTSDALNLTEFVVETTSPTVTSTVLDGSGTQGTAFDILVSFSENVSNVDITDFAFIQTDTTSGTSVTAGTITKVEAFDELFGTSTGDIADDTTTETISGQYFKVSVAATAGNITTTDIIFTFNTLSDTDTTKIIEDSAGNDIDLVNSGTNYTLNVDIDTSTTVITNATIVGSTLVLTSSVELQSTNTTGGGGFSVTGSDSTVYTITSVDVNGSTITITLDSSVTPTDNGTYSYDPDSTSALSVINIHNVSLGDITNAVYKPDLSLDFDGVGGYTVEEGLYLYLYTDDSYKPDNSTLRGLLADPLLQELAEDNIDAAIAAGGLLDFDGVGGYTVEEGLYLYLYTDDSYKPDNSTLRGLLADPLLQELTEDNIDAAIAAAAAD